MSLGPVVGVSTILYPWRGKCCASAGQGLTHIVFLLIVELSAASDNGGRGARVGARLLIVCSLWLAEVFVVPGKVQSLHKI